MELCENLTYLIYARNGIHKSKSLIPLGKIFLIGIAISLFYLTAIQEELFDFD